MKLTNVFFVLSSDSDSSGNNDPKQKKKRRVRKISSYRSSDSNQKPPTILVYRHNSNVNARRLHVLKHQRKCAYMYRLYPHTSDSKLL